MKGKLFLMFAICASFVGFTSVHLEATSAVPSQLVVALTRGARNTVVLSTNTIGTLIDPSISSGAGTDEQFIGAVEWNATQNGGVNQKLTLTQGEVLPSGGVGATGWFCLLQNATTLGAYQAVKVYTNVDVTSPADDYTYQTATAVNATAGSADLTGVAGGGYAGLIGVLSFYAIDETGNAVDAGTYVGTFIIAFAT